MQMNPNGDISAPGFRMGDGQLTLTNAILLNPKMGGDLHSTNWSDDGEGWLIDHVTGRLRANNVTMRKPSLMARIRAAIKCLTLK